MELPIFVSGHYKVTVKRYVVEMLFIIIERYVKLYIFDRVEIVHVRAMGNKCYCIESRCLLQVAFY